ncbi:MAG: hypothetical protein CM1200mP16_13150 [Nitrospina sp.]|nr:MAG: hypothetical protein CM1200mP16_13150 [Nitrospina sp.]
MNDKFNFKYHKFAYPLLQKGILNGKVHSFNFSMFILYFYTNQPTVIWAHSGHKHDELSIKLPKVVEKGLTTTI